jgi:hypothetical protein
VRLGPQRVHIVPSVVERRSAAGSLKSTDFCREMNEVYAEFFTEADMCRSMHGGRWV